MTVHAPLPEHAPPHSAKLQPGIGVAVNVTALSVGKSAEQVGPQSIRDGLLVTRPLPFTLTASGKSSGRSAVKVAVTE